MIKYCIFDFDGTLADTSEGIICCVRETLKHMRLPDKSDEQIRTSIGLPLAAALKMAGDIADDRIQEAVDTYRSLFFEVATQHILLFPGVKDCLLSLKESGVRLAIATSRGKSSLARILDSFDATGLFSELVTASDGISAKPAPDMVLYLLGKSGFKTEETLVIGDTTYDLMMGAGAGCKTCGVTWGNHSKEMLDTVSPDFVIDNIYQLISIVL